MFNGVILVAGPESTGTRVTARALAQHPHLRSAPPGDPHEDALNALWAGDTLDLGGTPVLTRRSLPAGAPGRLARSFEFPPLRRLERACLDQGVPLKVIVTARAPGAVVASATRNRSHVKGDPAGAARNYRWAYSAVFEWLGEAAVSDFVVSPVEALQTDGARHVRSLWRWAGLSDAKCDLSFLRPVNEGRL